MKKNQNLLQLAYKFIKDEIDEITYVNKHDREWYEVRDLASVNPDTFGLLIRKLSLPNRRKALIQAFQLKTVELRRLLLGDFSKSSSTIADLYNQSKSRRFSNELLAKFGIIHRVPFDWVYSEKLRNRWDFKNFEFAGEVVSKFDDLIPFLISSAGNHRHIDGYILRLNEMDCYFRIETRQNAVIIDLYNHDLTILDRFLSVLKSSAFLWHGFINRSVVEGYRFYTFVGVKHETSFAQLMQAEYKHVENINRLC